MNIPLDDMRWVRLCAIFGAVVLGTMLLSQAVDFLSLLSPVLTPFVVGAMIAYFGDPWADRLEQHPKISRTAAVAIVFGAILLLAVLIVLLLIPSVQDQITALIKRFPSDIERLRTNGLPAIGVQPEHVQHYLDLGYWRAWFVAKGSDVASAGAPVFAVISAFVADSLSKSSAAIVGFLVNAMIIPVVAFYLLRDWDHIVAKVASLLPRRYAAKVTGIVSEVDVVLGSFVRGQFSVMIGLGFIYSIGLWLIGIDGALLIGMFAGAVSFIPYMGLILGVIIAGLSALIQFQDIFYLLYVVLIFGVAQALEGMLLTPLLVGDKIGLHPVAVIFAVLIGEHLFGVTGMILALPIAAIAMVMIRRLIVMYKQSDYFHHQVEPQED